MCILHAELISTHPSPVPSVWWPQVAGYCRVGQRRSVLQKQVQAAPFMTSITCPWRNEQPSNTQSRPIWSWCSPHGRVWDNTGGLAWSSGSGNLLCPSGSSSLAGRSWALGSSFQRADLDLGPPGLPGLSWLLSPPLPPADGRGLCLPGIPLSLRVSCTLR